MCAIPFQTVESGVLPGHRLLGETDDAGADPAVIDVIDGFVRPEHSQVGGVGA